MTNLQIQYQNLQEKVRNDHAIEDENYRHNRAMEDVNVDVAAETKRHNIAMEALNKRGNEIEELKASITDRYNQAMAGVQWARAQEEVRHNLANEANQIYIANLGDTRERDIASLTQNSLNYRTLVTTNMTREQLTETARHNQATERNTLLVAGMQAGSNLFQTIWKGATTIAALG